MSKVSELFGESTTDISKATIEKLLQDQICPYKGNRCFKVRKSQVGWVSFFCKAKKRNPTF